HFYKFALVFNVLLGFTLLDREKRWLRDINVVALDQVLHVTEEESEQQRANMAAVHVGVGHQNDFSVAQLGRIEVFLRNAGTERGNHGANFFVRQHLVVARFFDVEDFSLQRKNRLKTAITALFRGAAGGLAFDKEQFAAL